MFNSEVSRQVEGNVSKVTNWREFVALKIFLIMFTVEGLECRDKKIVLYHDSFHARWKQQQKENKENKKKCERIEVMIKLKTYTITALNRAAWIVLTNLLLLYISICIVRYSHLHATYYEIVSHLMQCKWGFFLFFFKWYKNSGHILNFTSVYK